MNRYWKDEEAKFQARFFFKPYFKPDKPDQASNLVGADDTRAYSDT